jgi:hypothetical protein
MRANCGINRLGRDAALPDQPFAILANQIVFRRAHEVDGHRFVRTMGHDEHPVGSYHRAVAVSELNRLIRHHVMRRRRLGAFRLPALLA